MRRAAKVDLNQLQIVHAFRQMGATVHCTHTLGQGFPDLVVGFRNQNYLVEVKDSTQPPSKRKLTPDEEIFHRNWGGQVCIIESIKDVVDAMNRWRLK